MAYLTVAEANTYFANRLHTLAWDEASSDSKGIALEEATVRIDRLRFSGWLVDDDQDNEFPRYYNWDDGADDTEEVPTDIENATAEVALALLDGADPEFDYDNLNVSSTAYSSVRTSRNMQDTPAHTVAGIPSPLAWRFLLPWLAAASRIDFNRI